MFNHSSPETKVLSNVVNEFSRRLDRIQDPSLMFNRYKYAPSAYCEKFLKWKPWRGVRGYSGQYQIMQHYALTIAQQEEKRDYESGLLELHELKYWKPGRTIQNWVRVEAGHAVGKTMMAAGVISHFYDCFQGYGYCYAPTFRHVNDILFGEIRGQRRANNLPGRVLEQPILKDDNNPNHTVSGQAVQNTATEAIQGKHEPYMLFVMDEAEGVPDVVFDAVASMANAAPVAFVLMLANPRTRTSRFHKISALPNVKSYRLSCLNHPNVVYNRQYIPGAVGRKYVEMMMSEHCEEVTEHQPELYTFEVEWEEGKIFLPNNEFLFRVMGQAPESTAGDTFCPVGRFTAAVERDEPIIEKEDEEGVAWIGIDCARYGQDYGTIYLYRNGVASLEHTIYKEDGYEYFIKAKELIEKMVEDGCHTIEVRVDGGGGYGGSVIDFLNHHEPFFDTEYIRWFIVIEVHFQGTSYDQTQFADKITEMYYHAGEAVRNIAVKNAPPALEIDLCERKFKYKKLGGVDVKVLTPKESFRKENNKRSPDDGDGFALAVSPSYIFGGFAGIGFG